MTDDLKVQESATRPTLMERWRRINWIVIVLADAGLLAWGAMAALFLERLAGPGGRPILQAGYEGFTAGSWQALVDSTPRTTAFVTVLFRLYGTFNVAFALMAIAIAATAYRRREAWAWWSLLVGNTIAFGAAMTYDRIVNAIGPFEMLEYVGLAGVYLALAATAPFLATTRRRQSKN